MYLKRYVNSYDILLLYLSFNFKHECTVPFNLNSSLVCTNSCTLTPYYQALAKWKLTGKARLLLCIISRAVCTQTQEIMLRVRMLLSLSFASILLLSPARNLCANWIFNVYVHNKSYGTNTHILDRKLISVHVLLKTEHMRLQNTKQH